MERGETPAPAGDAPFPFDSSAMTLGMWSGQVGHHHRSRATICNRDNAFAKIGFQ